MSLVAMSDEALRNTADKLDELARECRVTQWQSESAEARSRWARCQIVSQRIGRTGPCAGELALTLTDDRGRKIGVSLPSIVSVEIARAVLAAAIDARLSEEPQGRAAA